MNPPTHTVAAMGYVLNGDRFLLLKRANPPLIWAPPGGRLRPDEDPREGLLREIREETGLEVRILGLLDIWFGEIPERGPLLSLDFLTVSESDQVRLDGEHTEFVWATLDDLRNGRPPLGGAQPGFSLADFQQAEAKCREYGDGPFPLRKVDGPRGEL